MPKGMYTQGIVVLFDHAVTLDELQAALSTFDIRKRLDESDCWEFGGPSLTIAYRPEVNGAVAVDTVDQPWPDDMGDPQSETMVFGAWSMGHFGPFAYPGGLRRAGQQSWTWDGGRTVAEQHRAFVRIRLSYIFGGDQDAPVMPADCDSLSELTFISKIALDVLTIPGALCYFNPNGELLADRQNLAAILDFGLSNNLPPIDAWANVRMYNVNSEWTMMDCVGNSQLDLPDVEVYCHSESYDLNAIANFIRNVTLYIHTNGEVINDGDTMDGPGEVNWQCYEFDTGVCDPPRRILRWLPLDGRPVPDEITVVPEPDSETES